MVDKSGICEYCGQEAQLSISHAVPNAIFKLILRTNNGKAIAFPANDGPLVYSSDTGGSPLLCSSCEAEFNKRFDGPLVNALKRWDKKICNGGSPNLDGYEGSHLLRSLASIFWRASVSPNRLYSASTLCAIDSKWLLEIMDSGGCDAFRMCSCSIARLYDHRNEGHGPSLFSQIVLMPHVYQVSVQKGGSRRHVALTVGMLGFLFHLYFPSLPHGKRNAKGFVKPKSKRLFAPFLHFADYPPLFDVLVEGVRKERDGNSRI